jgi:1-acyl-sn-glycerol-3-phosphate acyltransferase
MRLGEIGRGPLFEDEGPRGKRIVRRVRGIGAEIVGFVVVTALLPVLIPGAALADLWFKLRHDKPAVALRLTLFAWWFLLTEMWALLILLAIWLRSGGPFGGGSMVRRRGIYWLRPRWARSHLGAIKLLFGLRFEIEGLESASPGPVIVMIRHASIIDNMLPDTTIALQLGMGLRYVIKRELEAIPVIDIGGRWVSTNYINRASGDAAAEIARLIRLTDDLGADEGILIYPEGTRATGKKIARAQEIIRERQPAVAPLADQMRNLLPPRLTGPLALLEQAPDLDVVFCAHVGFDGFEYISDIWAGGLNGATIRIKLWRVPASEIPRDERGRIEWLYGHWLELDRWVGEQRAELGGSSASGKVGSGP